MKIALKTILTSTILITAMPLLMMTMPHDGTDGRVFLPWHPPKHRSFCFGSTLPTPEELDYLIIKIENGEVITYKQIQILLKKMHFAMSRNEEAALAEFTLFCNSPDFSVRDYLKICLKDWGIDVQIENELINKFVLKAVYNEYFAPSSVAPTVLKKIVSTAVEIKQNRRGYWRVKEILTEDELLDIFARQNQVTTVFNASIVMFQNGGSLGNQEVLDILSALNRVLNTNILALIALAKACGYPSQAIPNELIPVLQSCGINIENDGTISDKKLKVVIEYAIILRQKSNSISVEIRPEKELYQVFAQYHLIPPLTGEEAITL